MPARIALLLIAVTSMAVPRTGFADESLDPALPYRAKRVNPITYDVDFLVVVTAPYHTKLLKVWLPLPQSDSAQEVQEGDLTTVVFLFPRTIEITLENKRIEFTTVFGRISVTQVFYTQEMQFQGKLEL